MIHCIDDRDPPEMKGEHQLKVKVPGSQKSADKNSQEINININLRPGLLNCLNELSKSYQLVSFTASD